MRNLMANEQRTNHWQQAYEQTQKMWDERPDPMLVEYAGLIPPGNVLDLGIGEGRNAFFLARNGYEVAASILRARSNITPVHGWDCRSRRSAMWSARDSKGRTLISGTMTLQFMKPSDPAGF
jgi:hypothetical protein